MSSELLHETRFRKLWRQEAPLYAAHLRRLHPEDWRTRFMGAASRRLARRHVERIDWTRALVLGAYVRGRLRGAAELQTLRGTAVPEAELAITVERSFQGRSIGTELMRRLVTAARNRGIRRLHVIALAENTRMQRLIEKFAGHLRFEEGSVEGVIEVLPATFATLAEEGWQESQGVGERLRDVLRPLALRPLPTLLPKPEKRAA
jgi:RimJ/RimL family protein N-acetyltransferase